MEVAAPLFSLLITAAGMIFIFGIIGVTIYVSVRRSRQAQGAFAAAARQLGLQCSGTHFWGLLQGLMVDARVEARGSGKRRQYWTVVSAQVNPPLDLGLYVFRKGMLDDALGSILGSQDIPVGDPGFDAAFMVRGDEPSRVVAVMNHAVREGLRALDAGSRRCAVTDAGASVELHGMANDPAWLVWAAQTVASVATQLDVARMQVGAAAWLREHVPAWSAFAEQNGLRGQQTPLCIWGDLHGSQVWAYATRNQAHHHQLEVAVRLRHLLGIGLLIRPQRTLEGLFRWFGGKDLTLGDRAFDDRFIVQGARPEIVPRIVDEPIRTRIRALDDRRISVVVHDDGVVLRSPTFPRNPDEALTLLQEARALATAIEENAGRAQSYQVGPYR